MKLSDLIAAIGNYYGTTDGVMIDANNNSIICTNACGTKLRIENENAIMPLSVLVKQETDANS